MRKEWMEPVIEVQEFVANEYVAACGDSGKVYNFGAMLEKEEIAIMFTRMVPMDYQVLLTMFG